MNGNFSPVLRPLFLSVVAFLFILACAPSFQSGGSSTGRGFAVPMPAPVPTPAAPAPAFKDAPGGVAGRADFAGGGNTSTSSALSDQRRIIRNVQMSLVVQKLQEALDKVSSLAAKYDGFVVSSYRQGLGETSSASITIRVASDKTDDALKEIRGIATRVDSESSNSQDVTEEYVDVQARLKNLEATEQQFLEIMKRADKIEDILKVQVELSRVRSEIDQVKGRLQYLQRTTTTSLISVKLIPATSPEPLVRPGWSALETVKEAFRGLATTAQGFADALIWVTVYSPVWGVPAIIVGFVLWRLTRRWRRVGRQPSQ